MKEYITGDNGKVSIDESVVAQVAGLTALDCFGIVGMGYSYRTAHCSCLWSQYKGCDGQPYAVCEI